MNEASRPAPARRSRRAATPAAPAGWLDRARTAFRTDRRVRTLAFTLAVASVLWAKPMGLLLWARIKILTNIPRTAIADPGDGAPVLVRTRPDLSEPQELRVPGRPAADPFRIDDTVFPIPERPAETSRGGAKVAAGNAEEIDPAMVRERERSAMAAAFRVQAAGEGMGIAVVGGRTVKVGQSIEGPDGTAFRLVEVRGEGIVLECEGTRYEVTIARPGRGRNAGPSED
jgi:hypothetical protein